jgi:nicotinamide-nucleotide amidase
MTAMFPADVIEEAGRLIAAMKARGLKLATAESCTGGLIAGALTEIPGASDVLDRGFVTYSNAAKVGMLGVDFELILRHGAVSAEVARAMAEGALRCSAADLAVAATGIAGPGGGTIEKPVGLVYLAVAPALAGRGLRACRFGDIGRTGIRLATVLEAFALMGEALSS